MKPTVQISSERSSSFPLTDYHYQPTAKASFAHAKEKRSVQRLQGFWKLGSTFHRAEALRHDATDFLVFTLMGISCTWPIVSVGKAIAHVFLG